MAKAHYTVKEVAALLVIDEQTVLAKIKEGELTAYNIGTELRPRYRIAVADFENYLAQRRVQRSSDQEPGLTVKLEG